MAKQTEFTAMPLLNTTLIAVAKGILMDENVSRNKESVTVKLPIN